MNNLEIFIICHNKESYDTFCKNNRGVPEFDRFKYVYVGNHMNYPPFIPNDRVIVPNILPDNIEKYRTLLTFTAWYALVENNLIHTPYVGLFEYDVEIKDNLFNLEKHMDSNTYIGFKPFSTRSPLFLDAIPDLKSFLCKDEIEKAVSNNLWSSTTNVILPAKFLRNFVKWFSAEIYDIMKIRNHAHIHERIFNILALNFDMELKFFDSYVSHFQLKSHGIEL